MTHLGKVKEVGAAEYRHAPGRGFDQIVATQLNQTTAHKGQITGATKAQELTHGVAQDDLHAVFERWQFIRPVFTAPLQTVARSATKSRHFVKTLGVARHQYQQHLRALL